MRPESTSEGRPPTTGRARTGFTLVEMLIVIVVMGILVAIGVNGWRQFNESSIVDRAAQSIMADVTLTRSFAVQRGESVTMLLDEGGRSYALARTAAPTETLLVRSYSATTDLPLTRLEVEGAASSLAFNSRGILAGGGVRIFLARNDTERRIDVTALGRTRAVRP